MDGPTGSVDPAEYIGPTGPTTLTIADLLNASEIVRQKELQDKIALESIWSVSIPSLQGLLIQWAASGFPNVYPIQELFLQVPERCSDGVTRNLGDYITFCSGKTLTEHIALLQAKLPDITVAFSYTGLSIQVVVSRT